ncbi:MAG: IS66 family insertion sequence element accessory protein TnpB [Ruminococcus flavefaciens]|nr:IS66 family insertion sequence element accessory protein TnpB [Ruminococcus flavefaciens]
MDQITHDVRRTNWLNIIQQCQNRPEGMTAKQWMSDNGIRPKSYYYWLRKFRKESYELKQPHNDIAFHELPFPVSSQEPAPVTAAVSTEISPGNADAAVLVSRGDTVITVTNAASAELAALVIREVIAHA